MESVVKLVNSIVSGWQARKQTTIFLFASFSKVWTGLINPYLLLRKLKTSFFLSLNCVSKPLLAGIRRAPAWRNNKILCIYGSICRQQLYTHTHRNNNNNNSSSITISSRSAIPPLSLFFYMYFSLSLVDICMLASKVLQFACVVYQSCFSFLTGVENGANLFGIACASVAEQFTILGRYANWASDNNNNTN